MFYLGRLSIKQFVFQWAIDYWHYNKTIREIDFYLLENLIIYSYQANIIAILKPWFQLKALNLKLYNYKNVEI